LAGDTGALHPSTSAPEHSLPFMLLTGGRTAVEDIINHVLDAERNKIEAYFTTT
jgi:hypothetical protein